MYFFFIKTRKYYKQEISKQYQSIKEVYNKRLNLGTSHRYG